MLTGRVLGSVDSFVLPGSEERFSHRIIVTDPRAANGMPEIMLAQRRGELLGRVVAAAIGVKNSFRCERMIAGGHLNRLLDERRLVIIICRPADDLFRMAVDDRRQVKPALPRRNIRNVA